MTESILGVSELINQLKDCPNGESWAALLARRDPSHDEELAVALKERADVLLHSDLEGSLKLAEILLALSSATDSPAHHALGLLARANAEGIGRGEHPTAIRLYDQAASLYRSMNDETNAARAQIGKIASLATLGRYQEALEAARWASEALERNREWIPLAKVLKNRGAIAGRMGDDHQALEHFKRAGAVWAEHGDSNGFMAGLHINQAYVLTNLGRFDESMAESQQAIDLLQGSGETSRQARAKESMAETYYLSGRYNEALRLLEQAKGLFLEDGRPWDAAVAQVFSCECLLLIGRTRDAISGCREARGLFEESGTPFEVAHTLLIEATAQGRIGTFPEASENLERAKRILRSEGNDPYLGLAFLDEANLRYLSGEYKASHEAADRATDIFNRLQSGYFRALSLLAAARADLAGGLIDRARTAAERTLELNPEDEVSPVTLQAHHLLAQAFQRQGRTKDSIEEYQRAVYDLDHLRGHIMLEYRSDYLQDKEAIYQELVDLLLSTGRVEAALEQVGRAKSRVLSEILDHKVSLAIRPKTPEDIETVDRLNALRAQRDQIIRRWSQDQREAAPGLEPALEGQEHLHQQLREAEDELERLWHTLLIRNADYANEATLWLPHQDAGIPSVPSDTAIVEYFSMGDRLVAFAVTDSGLTWHEIPGGLKEIHRLIRFLRLNLDAVPHRPASEIPDLTRQANSLLSKLHASLIGPLCPELKDKARVVIVPHGALHYLPFQALRTEDGYLIETLELSYLPSLSLYELYARPPGQEGGILALGHSCSGMLPHAVHEAESVAAIWESEPLTEESATLPRLRSRAEDVNVIHLATHGVFRADNPLFSGLQLDDGWLTTYDVFGLKLKASLVTLSACETGQSQISAGDELTGLVRAFTCAGAKSLLISLWPINDPATEQWMLSCYTHLTTGMTKAAAVRATQREFLKSVDELEDGEGWPYAHPYYWAAFNLVGHAGNL